MRPLSEEKYSEETRGLWGKIIHRVAIFSAPAPKNAGSGLRGIVFFLLYNNEIYDIITSSLISESGFVSTF